MATRQLTVTVEEKANDITRNLSTLQFERAIIGKPEDFIRLRKRAHAISVNICAQATYFVDILNDARQVYKQFRNPQSRAQKLLQDYGDRDPLMIGVIGCGRIGSEIVQCLLTYGRIPPQELKISTRRPETLENFRNKGVECYFDNINLVKSVQVVFLCILPSQFPAVAYEIRDHITSGQIFYCISSSEPIRRLKQLLGTSNIVHPEFLWSEENIDAAWDYTQNISLALENRGTVIKTCPFFSNKSSETVVYVPDKLGEVMVYAFLNLCSHLGLNRAETLTTLHSVVFGHCEKAPIPMKLLAEDFGKDQEDLSGYFPLFDLVEVLQKKTLVSYKLQAMKVPFLKRYWQVFESYINLRAFRQGMIQKNPK